MIFNLNPIIFTKEIDRWLDQEIEKVDLEAEAAGGIKILVPVKKVGQDMAAAVVEAVVKVGVNSI